jgi:hypothetical protein
LTARLAVRRAYSRREITLEQRSSYAASETGRIDFLGFFFFMSKLL